MKVFFQKNLNFFCAGPQLADRQQQSVRRTRTQVHDAAAEGQKGGAEGLEPQPDPSREGEGDVHAHHARPGPQGPEKQGERGEQPEQQVQQRAQEGSGAAAEGAQQVVHQPQAQAQQQRPGEGEELLGDRHAHQRSSREKKPPLVWRSS